MRSLDSLHDVLLLDLDGTVYRGEVAVPGAAEALGRATARQYFVTNNASRTPADVAAHLVGLGFTAATVDHVVTSAQSAARLAAERVPAGSRVLALGTAALAEELEKVGLRAVSRHDEAPVAVVQGLDKTIDWARLAEATLALREGAVWIAANIDTTLPSERGLLPGNGALVAALASASGRTPEVAGKPARPLLDDAIRRSGAQRPLVVGDRLDTDIEAAHRRGVDSLLVLTGVSQALDVLRAGPERRPTYIAADLAALGRPADDLRVGARPEWSARWRGDDIVLSANGSRTGGAVANTPDGDADCLRAAAVLAWERDGFGELVGADDEARSVVARWSH